MAPEFVRKTVRDMDGYTPGEQPAVHERVVKLNTNENPFPPSEQVLQAIQNISSESLRRYPSPSAEPFRHAAAKVHGVDADMILAGNGSDDILTIATRTFIPASGTLAYCDPTYSLYPVLARLQDARIQRVAWGDNWSLPIEALASTKADAIYLANPNAPTGTLVAPAKVAELAEKFQGAIVVDEAYVDFAGENCLSLVRRFPNIIISRTLSKAYSLAGLRFGYAIAQPTVIAEMNKVKDSYNCDAIAVAAATAAILDQDHARRSWEHIRSERDRVIVELTQLGWSVLPSQANFILATSPTGEARTAYQALKGLHILVRYFDLPGLQDKLRITIGTLQDNNAFLAGIRSLSVTRNVPSPDEAVLAGRSH